MTIIYTNFYRILSEFFYGISQNFLKIFQRNPIGIFTEFFCGIIFWQKYSSEFCRIFMTEYWQNSLREVPSIYNSTGIMDTRILIFSRQPWSNFGHLTQVFLVHAAAGIKIHPCKTKLFQSEVEDLGHRISKEGVVHNTRVCAEDQGLA